MFVAVQGLIKSNYCLPASAKMGLTVILCAHLALCCLVESLSISWALGQDIYDHLDNLQL